MTLVVPCVANPLLFFVPIFTSKLEGAINDLLEGKCQAKEAKRG